MGYKLPVSSSAPPPGPSDPDPENGPESGAGADDRSSSPSGSGETDASTTRGEDPLRGSRTSGFWFALLAMVVVLLLLAIFVIQNTQTVEVSMFGWTGSAPLSATLLVAAVGGALIVASAGALRIIQLRRRIKRLRKQ